jgi:hypothetical protein
MRTTESIPFTKQVGCREAVLICIREVPLSNHDHDSSLKLVSTDFSPVPSSSLIVSFLSIANQHRRLLVYTALE